MPRPTRADLERHRGARVDDLIGPGLRLLFVGIGRGEALGGVDAVVGDPRLVQRRPEPVAGAGEVGVDGGRPEARVDADEQ